MHAASELAVSLSKYAGESDGLECFRLFIEGYFIHGKLTAVEADVLPDLITLRIISNVVYFVGRAIAGEDKIDTLTNKVETYYNRIDWINKNKVVIVDMLKSNIDNIDKPNTRAEV